MQNYIKRYFIGLSVFLIILFLASAINKIPFINITGQSASVLSLVSGSDAKPAYGYAWNDNIGWINFGTTTTSTEGQVYISNNKLYGYAWGENVGWISLSCENDNSCGTSNYGVTQSDSNGILTGYAWGENIGWIDFKPTGGGVTITTETSGVNSFSGYAWGENIGWVSFSGISPTYGVKTTWTKPYSSAYYQTCTYNYSEWTDCVRGEQSRTATPSGSNCANSADQPLTQSCTEAVATTTATSTEAVATTTTTISVSINPSSTSTIYIGETLQFTATVSGTTTNNGVNWTILPVDLDNFYGMINDDGLYTAPDHAVTIKIVAKSKADVTKIDTAPVIVRLIPPNTPISISINHSGTTTVFVGETFQFSASVIGTTTNNGITWILPDEDSGTVNDTGLYTAPNFGGIFHLIAKPHADISKSDETIIDVRLRPVEPEATTTPEEKSILDKIIDVAAPGFEKTNNTDQSTGGSGGITSGGGSSGGRRSIPAILNVSEMITNNIAVLGTTTERIYLEAKKIVESPTGSAVTNTITTAGVVGGAAATSVFALNTTTIADLLFLPFRLWGLLLSALGLKKRNRPWGTVYDSVTKQPIDPAYVTLRKLHTKDENMSITDLDGRYGFLVSPGEYVLTANKTNYKFPSKKLAGKTEDSLYNNLYFGETLDIKTAGVLINKNIPLDPVKFDWNEFTKGKKKLMKYYSRREKIMHIATDWIFRAGFVISLLALFLISAPYNLIIFGLYIILALLRKFGLKQKALGSLTEKNGEPLSFAVIRIISSDLGIEITNKVADEIGRYYCLVNKGKYYVKIEKKNDDESYSLVYTSPVFSADSGIINKSFTI